MYKQAAVTGQPSKFSSESLCSPVQCKENIIHAIIYSTRIRRPSKTKVMGNLLYKTLGIISMNNCPWEQLIRYEINQKG